jgi:hypothetical protein
VISLLRRFSEAVFYAGHFVAILQRITRPLQSGF